MKNLILAIIVGHFFSSLAFAVSVNSSSTKLTIYGVWLSTSADCTSPVQVSSDANGTEVDINQSPVLGTGAVAAGTYKCLIIKINAVIKFTPATSDGANCTSGHEYTFNTCLASNSVNTSKNPITGAIINCTGTSVSDTTGDELFLYVSRNSACSGTLSSDSACTGIFTNAWVPPTSAADVNHGFKLSSDITISGNTSGSFVFNTDSQIDTNAGACDLEGFDLSYK